MNDKYKAIISKDVFKNVSQDIKDRLVDTLKSMEGKSIAECMMLLANFNASLPKGQALSIEDQLAMKTAVMESLEPEERDKFEKVLKWIETINGNMIKK